MPADVCAGAVTICFPCCQFLPEFVDTCYPLRKTLSCHDIKLYLCHVQPASVLWGIMNLQFSGDPACLMSRKSLIQRSYGMSIEIVRDKYDFLVVRVAGIYKIFDFLSPVGCGTVFTATYMPYAPSGSTNTNILHVPFLTYSESVFRVSPGRVGSGSRASPNSW